VDSPLPRFAISLSMRHRARAKGSPEPAWRHGSQETSDVMPTTSIASPAFDSRRWGFAAPIRFVSRQCISLQSYIPSSKVSRATQ
jgi:hypothetical protein